MGIIVMKTLAAGVMLAAIASCIGSVIQWRRMSFFSDALTHSALLGIGLSFMLGINLLVGLGAVLVLCVLMLHALGNHRLPVDSILALFAHLSLAGGVVLLYLSGNRIHWESLLFGNILALTNTDLLLLAGTAIALAIALAWLWPSLVAMAINSEVAAVEVKHRNLVNLAFLLLVCLYVAVGVRLVGVLLLNALLVIPAATARIMATSPTQMVVLAAVFGCASIVTGIAATFTWDVPAAPVCVLFAGLFFVLVLAYDNWRRPSHNRF